MPRPRAPLPLPPMMTAGMVKGARRAVVGGRGLRRLLWRRAVQRAAPMAEAMRRRRRREEEEEEARRFLRVEGREDGLPSCGCAACVCVWGVCVGGGVVGVGR